MKKIVALKRLLVCILILLLILMTSACSGDTVEKNRDENVNVKDDKDNDEQSNDSNESKDNESQNDSDESKTEKLYPNLNLKLDIQNPDDRHEKYLVFLLPTGTRNTEKGAIGFPRGGYASRPFVTDENDEVSIDISDKRKYEGFIEGEQNKQPGSFEVFITTEEDFYLRNPLNETTIIKVEEVDKFSYGVKEQSYTIPIVDKYPDGVLSLTFPDATFVIKLQFAEGVERRSSYTVGISKAENPSYVLGRLCRNTQYYDTPFFVEDELDSWSGRIVIYGEGYNDEISYAEYPMDVTFTKGKCEQGDIIVVTVTK